MESYDVQLNCPFRTDIVIGLDNANKKKRKEQLDFYVNGMFSVLALPAS